MDKQKLLEVMKKQKKEQAKKYYIYMNEIIKRNPEIDMDTEYVKYFLKYL